MSLTKRMRDAVIADWTGTAAPTGDLTFDDFLAAVDMLNRTAPPVVLTARLPISRLSRKADRPAALWGVEVAWDLCEPRPRRLRRRRASVTPRTP